MTSVYRICWVSAIYNNSVEDMYSLNFYIADILGENGIHFQHRLMYKIYMFVLLLVYCDTFLILFLIYFRLVETCIMQFLKFYFVYYQDNHIIKNYA